jgi:hypothetical protein
VILKVADDRRQAASNCVFPVPFCCSDTQTRTARAVKDLRGCTWPPAGPPACSQSSESREVARRSTAPGRAPSRIRYGYGRRRAQSAQQPPQLAGAWNPSLPTGGGTARRAVVPPPAAKTQRERPPAGGPTSTSRTIQLASTYLVALVQDTHGAHSHRHEQLFIPSGQPAPPASPWTTTAHTMASFLPTTTAAAPPPPPPHERTLASSPRAAHASSGAPATFAVDRDTTSTAFALMEERREREHAKEEKQQRISRPPRFYNARERGKGKRLLVLAVSWSSSSLARCCYRLHFF